MRCRGPRNRVNRMTVASERERHEHCNGPVGRYCLFHFQTPSQVLWADGPTSGHFDFKGLSLSHKDAAAQSIVAVLSTAYAASALCLLAHERFLPLSLCNRGDKTLQTSCDIFSAKLSDTVISLRNVFPLMMKLTVTGLILASSALVTGCAVYPDGTPAYATGGGYSAPAYPGYPAGYEAPPPGYEAGYGYGGPVVQSGVIIDGGGGYYGGPGPRYWSDGPGYRRPPPPGGWGDRGGNHGNQGGNGGGDRGGHGGQQAGSPQGGRPAQPQAGNPGRPAPAPAPQAQQSRGSVPYVGKSLWGKEPARQPENNH
jgi:hypothetical protein